LAVLHVLNSIFLVITLWATALGLGMHFSLAQILAPLQRRRLMSVAVLLNVAVVPVVAWALTNAFRIDPGYSTGILLIAFASAAPAALKLAQIERGDVAYAVSLVVLLSVLNIAAIPLWSALLLPGDVRIDPVEVATTLLVNILLPLGIGLLVKSRYLEQAQDWAPKLNTLSTLALVIVIVSSIVVDFTTILALFGSAAILAGILLVLMAFLLGYFSGGSDPPSRRVTATVTSCRAAGPALLIATESFPMDPKVTAGVIAVGLIASLLPAIVAMEWGRRSGAELDDTTLANASQRRSISQQKH
jgi:BASS family bile acid:Na+ symporter